MNTKSSAVISAAATAAMLRFSATASVSLASMVGSSARKRLSGRVAPPCTLVSLPCRSSSVKSRRMVDSLVCSASHSCCTVTVRFSFSCSKISAKRSSASMVFFLLPFSRLTVSARYWRVLVVCIFIIAKILSKSISFSHFCSQRIFIIFVQSFQYLGYKSFLHAKRPPHLCMRWSFLRFCDRS